MIKPDADLETAHQMVVDWQDTGSEKIYADVTDFLSLETKIANALAVAFGKGREFGLEEAALRCEREAQALYRHGLEGLSNVAKSCATWVRAL